MTRSDDIITRLHAQPGPDGCYYCGEYGCANEDGDKIPWHTGTDDNLCACTCHTWIATVTDAADEISRLRDLVHRWKNAAEAYERGSLSQGDKLIDEARKGNQP